MGRVKTDEQRDFVRFVMENCGCPSGGTASSYEHALFVLNLALQKAKPSYAPEFNVWKISDVAEIKALYDHVLKEQRSFIKEGTGIFSVLTVDDAGPSFYKKRWCSAALRFLEKFRTAQQSVAVYEGALQNILEVESNPKKASASASLVKLTKAKAFLPDGISPSSKEGRMIVREVRVRANQKVFRRAILNNYQERCCITGVDVPAVLDAAHLQDWSDDLKNALDVTNGVCLSATYHRAFDAHLVEIGDHYQILLSDALKAKCSKSTYDRYFKPYKDKIISLPANKSLWPDMRFLSKHAEKMVK